jgi:hypothetical protein
MTETDRLIELVAKLRAYHIISKRDEFIDAAEAIERLMVALKPFADAADNLPDDYMDGDIWQHPVAMKITVENLRAAHAAYLGENKL